MVGSSKFDFLDRVMLVRTVGPALDPLRTDDDYVRDHIRIAAQALQFGLVRLAGSYDDIGYELRITPAGRLLRNGRLTEAAAAIDSGSTTIRINGHEPTGPLAGRLRPGNPPIDLDTLVARTYAPELLRCIAAGHARVAGNLVRSTYSLLREEAARQPVATLGGRHLNTARSRAAR